MTRLFGHSVRSGLLLLYVAETLACFALCYTAFHWQTAGLLPAGSSGAITFPSALAICSGVACGASGLYQPEAWMQSRRLVVGAVTAAALLTLLAWIASQALLPASASAGFGPALVALGFVGVVMLTRLGLAAASRTGRFRSRVVVVRAPGQDGEADRWTRQETFLDIAFLDVAPTASAAAAVEEELSPARLRASRTWAVVAEDPSVLPASTRARLSAAGVRLLDRTEFFEHRLGRVDLLRLPVNWAAGHRRYPAEAALRRGFDLTLSLALIVITLPVLLLASLAIKLDSPGPIFYRQDRVGRGGRVFSLLKFRSMVVDAEVGGAPRWATQRDPRVTRIGRFLRLTRIDEIPQVLNVLRGDMAFVGPRPERPAFVEQLAQVIPHYAARHLVKPGITGWAQVNYPYGASVADARMKLTYDLYYIRRRSLFLDLLILVATIRVVLFQEGSR
ncbi:exopolysaccharide biosynthesis polyprenyl glycosylphosphotransferase [Roseomonas sp. BN140053]|uniref:exopolysaccharide biosynthesis polyprenyl glycosylphosphotransferase n=1 Tax=Roseomonas sp. BN140053 TaxID=3391898 RepID=UPI0039EC049E